MLTRSLYQEILETRKEIEKNFNQPLDIDVIRKIGHTDIVEVTTPVLITCHDFKYRLFSYFRALNNYTKADRYPILRITNSQDKLAKEKYLTKMESMKWFHQNGVKPNPMNVLRILCHMGIYEYARMHWPTSKRLWTQSFKKKYWNSGW
ncbi:hypothetical protein O181_057680 [Austropuccinia psidii MF-1]|uniref:Uncharacterized protein n=1 Tax=Austropuccinia psidii MF-1 TaxID=1389203 RepID=A0A9Q3E8A8_9BASI|nr:hypothetical protein [Austropuccinia psidii MF-1]